MSSGTTVARPPQGTDPTAVVDPTVRRWLVTAGVTLLSFVYLAVTVVVTGGVDPFDPAVYRTALALHTPAAVAAAGFVTTFGSAPVVGAATVLGAVLLGRRTRSWRPVAVLLASTAVAVGAVCLLKVAIARPGPSGGPTTGLLSFDYAFPSGHTTGATVVFVLTALLLAETLRRGAYRRLVIGTGLLVGLLVGVSRVYLGYHWATDVLAGWFLSAAVIGTAMAVARLLSGPAVPGSPTVAEVAR